MILLNVYPVALKKLQINRKPSKDGKIRRERFARMPYMFFDLVRTKHLGVCGSNTSQEKTV